MLDNSNIIEKFDFPFYIFLHVMNTKTKQDVIKRKLNYYELPV
jgi:hypothetical protein